MIRRKRISGVTLLELLVALGLSTLLMVALSYAFVAGLGFERAREVRRRADLGQDRLEEQLRFWIEGATIGEEADTTGLTYFIGTLENGDDSLGCDRLTFTSPGLPPSLTDRADVADFETRNTNVGTTGGLAEVSVSTSPVGDTQRSGLFTRTQRPADTDPEQGGFESVMDPNVVSIGFAFWNGTDWATSWDTRSMTPPRLPAAVRVRYRRAGDDETVFHELIVPVPQSDVDASNPVAMDAQT